MASASALRRGYLRAIEHWPSDPIRPELSFADFLQNRVKTDFGIAEDGKVDGSVKPVTAVDFNAEDSKRQLNAIMTLLDNRYKQKYPVTDHILRPASNPDYYQKLVDEIDEAPKRSWLGRKINAWKGWIRMN
ncbi:hypothetical protein BJ508DRAFT_363016 [Ascobolus immersus RN42]|uniref:Uncharacterized protein n=1 Tax=Ascobolus immersus RN42 TaxID=1160509 RepID=A0A3N4I2W3_ASCIM|nr:hypothetical protein BJ508DRAFT_363016 [Ascobolus immersus RN42]